MIFKKNHSNWNNAKLSLEKMIFKTTCTNYYIDDWDWYHSIENTLKIKDDNNLKEFQILNIKNNLCFDPRNPN